MTTHVTLGEDVVLKRFSDATAASAALDRAKALQAAGIATPLPIHVDDVTLRFPRITGITGPDLITTLPDLLAPLRDLHMQRLPTLDLQQHDPLLRIRPRLNLAPEGIATVAERQLQHLPARAETLCHGDFHPGQVIRDTSGRSWLLDLDDLALGPVEADLGNLIAWLATRPVADAIPLRHRLNRSRDTVLAAWATHGDRVDRERLAPYETLAVLRRALKRAEQGDPTQLEEVTEIY